MRGRKMLWVVLAIITITLLTGCDSLLSGNQTLNESFKNYWQPNAVLENVTDPDANITYVPPEIVGYRIGSYNLQIFGVTKARNEPVIQGFRQVMNDYDILAVQEIRDKSESAFPNFMIDQLPQYNYVVSERLGRTSSKEQYAFIWTDRASMRRPAEYPDGSDWFERPPFAAHFTIKNDSYVIIQTHIKPDEAEQEIPHLVDVVEWAEEYYGDNDIILLGDLNADCAYFDGDFDESFKEVIKDTADTTTTRTNCAYDRIYTRGNIEIRDSGVDHYGDDGINEELAKAMSDHWAIFMVIA